MMFPGGAGGAELQKAASDKAKGDLGTFITFGLIIEAIAIGSSYFGIDWILV